MLIPDREIKKATRVAEVVARFDQLPDSALVDVRVVAAWRGVSVDTVQRRVREKRLPAPIRDGLRCTRWRVGDLRRATASAAGA